MEKGTPRDEVMLQFVQEVRNELKGRRWTGVEKGTPRDEVMLQFVQEARNGASHDEITAKIKEHYFPVEVEPDPVAHIRQRLASEVADSVFLLAKFADDVQAQKEAAAAEQGERQETQ